jgi:TonB family protein
MLRDRLRELLVYFRRRKPKADARQTPSASPPVILPKEPRGLTVRIYSVQSTHSPKGLANNEDLFDLLLGSLIVGMLIVGGTHWNSRLGKLTEPRWRGSTSGHASSPSGFRGLEAARATTPTYGANTEDQPDLDSPPAATWVLPASYTEEARNAGFHGTVSVTVYVDALGVPQDVKATSPIPFGLESTIRPAVFQWRFRPAFSRGVAVASKTTVEVPFQ